MGDSRHDWWRVRCELGACCLRAGNTRSTATCSSAAPPQRGAPHSPAALAHARGTSSRARSLTLSPSASAFTGPSFAVHATARDTAAAAAAAALPPAAPAVGAASDSMPLLLLLLPELLLLLLLPSSAPAPAVCAAAAAAAAAEAGVGGGSTRTS